MRESNSKTAPISLRANTVWNAFGCLFYLGCQWLITVLVVLLSSGYENSGILAFAMATGNMFSAIGLFKIRTFQVSDISREYSDDNYVAFRLITIGASLFLTIGYLAFSTGFNEFTIASIAYLLFKGDETFNDVFFGIEQSSERMDYIGKSQILRGIGTLLGFSIPLYFTDNLIIGILGMAALCIPITVLFDRRNARLFGFTRPKISMKVTKALLLACLMPTVANLLATSIVSIARQQYGSLCGDELLGMYASIATPAVLVQAAASYLYSPLIGKLAKTRITDGNKAFVSLFIKILVAMITCIAVVSLLLTIPGKWAIVTIFGSALTPYIWIFPFVLISTGAVALLYYVNDVLLIIRTGKTQLIINGIALFLSITLLTPLVRVASMNGINLAIISGCAIATTLGTAAIIYLDR